MVSIFGTTYIPGQAPSADWIPWLDSYELAIYEQEAADAARNQPAVPSVPPGADSGA